MSLSQTLRSTLRPAHRRIAQALPLELKRHYLYAANMHRYGNFTNPKSYNEKMNWRIINDRRPCIIEASDKLSMKETARHLIPDSSELRIPATLWAGRPDELPRLDDLPPFVVKPNNGSGDVAFSPISTSEIVNLSRRWRHSSPADQLGEWGYQHARNLLLIEELIPSVAAGPPTDYKFFVFDGRVSLIQVNTGRFSSGLSYSFYSPEWEMLPVGRRGYPKTPSAIPDHFDRMLEISKRLAHGWDHLRVDLYNVDGEIWFGELSPYHNGGVFAFDDPRFDARLGREWVLPRLEDVS